MEELKQFCYKYQAQVGKSSKVWRRTKPISYSVFNDQGMSAFDNREYQEVPMVDITMPEDRFRALLEHDDWIANAGLYDNNHFNNNVSRVSNMVVAHERECRIRQENPSVRAAYEKYQTLLRLVDSHYD